MKKLILFTVCILCSFFLKAKDIYVHEKNGSSSGNGQQNSPYSTIEDAVKYAQTGDRIFLLSDLVHRSNHTFVIDKEVTIFGDKKYGILFRGMHLELKANVIFKDISLKFLPASDGISFLPDGKNSSKIYVSDHTVVFDNVNTQININQNFDRPTIFAGSYSGTTSGNGANIIFRNSNSQTLFIKIWLGSENFPKDKPTNIELDDFVKSNNGIDLSGGLNAPVSGKVKVLSSSKINNFTNVGKSSDNEVTIKGIKYIYNVHFSDLKDLVLESTNVTSSNFGVSGNLSVASNSSLTISDKSQAVSVENILGDGEIIIPLIENSFEVKQNISNQMNIKLDNMWINDLKNYIDKFYLVAKSGEPNVSLHKEQTSYLVTKKNQDNLLKWTISNDTFLGIEEFSKTSKIQLYPTLVSNDFFIKSQGKIENITVLDLSGKQIKSFTPNYSNQYSISELSKGFYLVVVTGETESQSFKIIKD